MKELGNRKGRAAIVRIGIALMIALTATKIVPASNIAGYSVFVGIAFFFVTEAVSRTPDPESGLRFRGVGKELKKPDVLLWMALPSVSGILTLIVGNWLFGGAFATHVVGRTSAFLSFDQGLWLAVQLALGAFGEEIAYRGFFLGKGMKLFPFWLCMLVSSLAFAFGHLATGNLWLVAYDVAGVFVDSLIYSMIYYKTNNCVMSTLAHLLANAISIAALFLFVL